jgi:YD repeat-containing protein
MMKRTLVVLFVLAAAGTAAQSPPERERGFKPDLTYQLNDVDSVNLFNGNLNLTLPLAPYPVGPDVSYDFVIRYAGKLWKDFEFCSPRPTGPDECRMNWRPQSDGMGLGWRMTLGELNGARSLYGPDSGQTWQYVSPDGSEHNFYPTLHEPVCPPASLADCDPYVAGTSYTRDGTYLRLREVQDAKIVEFADGQRQRFTYDSTTSEWRLQYIYGASSSLDGAGLPTTNWVKFEYSPNPVAGAPVADWSITDSHGRSHQVIFQSASHVRTGVIDKIRLAAFRGPGDTSDATAVAEYNFTYDNVMSTIDGPESVIAKPYVSDSAAATVRLLRRVDLPTGEVWKFTYDQPSTGPYLYSGTLKQVDLPTGGSFAYSYQPFDINTSDPLPGVLERQMLDASGQVVQSTLYSLDYGTGRVTLASRALSGATWRPESKIVNHFNYTYGAAFGLPFSTTYHDGTEPPRHLSTETFKCNPSQDTCTLTPERQQYVRYEMDSLMGTPCNIDAPCARERNRRVVSERTLYVSDGNRYADVDRSGFDGLGHFRTAVTGGTFTSGNVRKSYRAYNVNTRDYSAGGSTVGTYLLTSSGQRVSGFSMLLSSDAWNLNTFTDAYVREDVVTNGVTNTVTAWTESCFDPTIGFLSRQQTKVLDDGSDDPIDLVVVYRRDPASGYADREERFGGDGETDLPEDLCSFEPAHSADSRRVDYTTQVGALKTKRHVNGVSGVALPFFAVENAIDRNTALVKESKDVSGRLTTYVYDRIGRLSSVAPPGESPTNYTYTRASGTLPASVKAITGTGTTRMEQTWEFDAFGRISIEKRLMPDSTLSGIKTTYDHAGRRKSVSEQETVSGAAFNPVNVTTFSGYDPFGRVGSVVAPDGKVTTFTYSGERLTTRTFTVAKPLETSVSVMEERDRAGRLIKVIEDSGASAATTDYGYDVGSHLASVTMRGGGGAVQTRQFNYDRRGLLTSETHPESGVTSYEYDASGSVVTRVTPMTTLEQSYDPAGRLLTVKAAGATVKSFLYDRPNADPDFSLGKLDTATRHNFTAEFGDVQVTEKYQYSQPGGRLSRRDTTVNRPLPVPEINSFYETYEYDGMGQLRQLQYPTCGSGGCLALAAPTRTVIPTYTHGLVTDIAPYTYSSPTSGISGITYHPNALVAQIRHRNVDGSAGPKYEQTIAQGMARPASIKVSSFCDSSNLDITTHPASRTISSGSAAGLSVVAPGATSYQWYKASGSSWNEVGDDTATLSIALNSTSEFFVRVGNGACTLDSSRATVTVQTCVAPEATISAPLSLSAGASAMATVPATTNATYQWSITGGTIVSGAGTREIEFRAGCSGQVALAVTVTASCAGSDTHSVVVSVPSATVTGTQAIAQGATATIQASLSGIGPWTVTWSDSYTQNLPASATTASRTVTPGGTTSYTVTALSGNGCSGTFSGTAVITVTPPAPAELNAWAVSPNQVNLIWSFSGVADRFDVYRAGGYVGSSTSQSYEDHSVQPSSAYVYTVRAVKVNTMSAPSAKNLATTILFGDDPAAAGVTPIRAVHVTQLQAAVNAVRVAAGLSPATFAAALAGQPVLATHIDSLRTALAPARTNLGLPAVTYTRAVVSGILMRAYDINETRAGVR